MKKCTDEYGRGHLVAVDYSHYYEGSPSLADVEKFCRFKYCPTCGASLRKFWKDYK